MRDLYNRQQLQERSIARAKRELKEPDREDVFILIDHMLETEKSSLWIVRCITALLSLRRQLGKPFGEATKDDIKGLVSWIEQKKYIHFHEWERLSLR